MLATQGTLEEVFEDIVNISLEPEAISALANDASVGIRGTAGHKGVSNSASRAGTNGGMIPDPAVSPSSAGSSAARVFTLEVVASLARATVRITFTFTSVTPDKRVSKVAGWAGTDRAVSTIAVKARLADGVRSTGVRVAQVLLGELTARCEWVASESSGTRADSLVVLDLAVGAPSTGVRSALATGILTLEPDAGQVGTAVVVAGALGVAPGVGLAEEVLGASTLGAVVLGAAVGILSTGILVTYSHTVEVLTLLSAGTFPVGFALPAAPSQRIANEVVLASAHRATVESDTAVCVDSTSLVTDLLVGEDSTALERISSVSLGASADGHMVAGLTVSSVSARKSAGIDTSVILAGLAGTAVIVGDAVTSKTFLESVSNESVLTGA